ncbi:MAG TPA: protease inhibitor I42 family protein [Chloroflexia bacterium]|nr:protease inhibitor I42 family protein [Chloroflexia bacterium]
MTKQFLPHPSSKLPGSLKGEALPRSSATKGSRTKTYVTGWIVVVSALICATILLLSLGGISMQKPKTVEIDQSHAGSTVLLQLKDQLQISLEGNPTTGYTWEVAQIDNKILKLNGEPEFQPANALAGSGGKMILNFDTVGAGTTTLKLIYHRVFEPNVAPLNTYQVTVTVNK